MLRIHILGMRAMKACLLPVAALILEWQDRAVQSVEMLLRARARPEYFEGWIDRWARLTTLQTHLRAELGAELYEAAARRGQLRQIEEAAASVLEDPREHSEAEA